MVYRFMLLAEDSDEFVREIEIAPEATFFDFHKIILKACGYKDDQMTSFFICDEDWGKETEITLEAMDASSHVHIMRDTTLKEYITKQRQRLLYEFDPLMGRDLFIELMEIKKDKDCPTPKCVKSEGKAPSQEEDPASLLGGNDLEGFGNDDDEYGGSYGDTYDSSNFNEEDFDGMSISDGNPYQDD